MSIQNIDQSIFLFFNSLHANWADVFFYFVSYKFTWLPLYLLIFFLIIQQWKRKSIWIFLVIALTILFTDQTCTQLKHKVKRLRPSHNVELVEKVHLIQYPNYKEYKGGKFGFPSSHAANSIVLPFFVLIFLPKYKKWLPYLLFLWTILIGYSRIYLGVHYPTDIIVGYCIGASYALLFALFLNKILMKKKKQIF